MNNLFKIITLGLFVLLSACGGSSNDSTNKDDKTPPTQPVDTVTMQMLVNTAVEATRQVAKFKVSRENGSGNLNIEFQLSGREDITLGSASLNDYLLKYADGSDVGESIIIGENESSRIIEVVPVADNFHEVPVILTVSLQQSSQYELEQDQIQINIIDNEDIEENRKVFYSTFRPQGDAITSASGVLSFILAGDNSHGYLNYSFSNLASQQTDQHIHMAPSGQAVKDIMQTGNISNWRWDLEPGAIYKSEQEMLDALFEGVFFVNIHTANYAHGEISATLQYDENVAPPQEGELTKEDIDRDIIRFLTQATFGATEESYQQLREQIMDDGSNRIAVYNQWIENQILTEANSMLAFTEALQPHFIEEDGWNIRRDAFWNMAVHGKDQLRQRMTFALSQILVISDETAIIRKAYKGTANYWDLMANNAFGQYNELLKQASLNPIMGIWLSHLRNQKEDVDKGYFPDENYAREIMQLFSFGLVHRNSSGAIMLGADNLPIQTYDNESIRNMARVFTGLSFSYKLKDGVKQENNWFLTGDAINDDQYRWLEPMKFFSDYHDYEEKSLFNDGHSIVTIDKNSNQSHESAMAELTQTIDATVAHTTTAPFISRQLIQRLVTSNPSQAYIERVATAFGRTGDLKAVIKAILLDPEARNPSALTSTTFGKLKEPVLQLSATLRLFNSESKVPLGNGVNGLNLAIANGYQANSSLLRLGDVNIGQRALGASSVFNFYLPDYAPAGELSGQSLVAPELQLQTESQLYTTINQYYQLIYSGVSRGNSHKFSPLTSAQLLVNLNYDALEQVWEQKLGSNQEKAQALLNYVDFYLLAGQLQLNKDEEVINLLVNALEPLAPEYRYKLLLYIINASPQFILQR